MGAIAILPQREPQITDYGDLLEPGEAAEPILSKAVRNALTEWLTEIWAEPALVAAGLKARRRAIFGGKPGTGKTTLAHHLSARLGLPMLVVRPERLIDSWVGSSGRNIGGLFDAAGKRKGEHQVLLFMDEFDAVAVKRGPARQSADEERNAWVNTLLQRIEQYDGFLIAATNFTGSIDPAVWRRFHIQIDIDLPGPFERERILARYLAPWGLPKPALRLLAESFATASPALMREFAEGLKRQIIIGPLVDWDMRRDQVIERLLAAIQPHPDFGKPRLWAHGAKDDAVRALPWPLPKADEIVEEPEEGGAPPPQTVVPLRRAAP